ncbi:MAG: amidohydrolase family protein [Cyclobacteriaceae bacterium]|nr:amidohydrolase family protein [Cyclobacteriaceae bacterium]
MKNFLYTFILVFSASAVMAQLPQPAEPQPNAILLKGGIAHLGNGKVIQNSLIGFDEGKITLVGDATRSKIDVAGYTVIDITGQHVYPGFILPNSSLGLEEVSAVRATRDANETGQLKPHIRSLVAYNTDSKIPPTLRYNGILVAETTPMGGRISGTSSVMNLEGWNWEDAVLKADVGVHMSWPSKMGGHFDFSTFTWIREPNKKYDSQVEELVSFFDDAKSYLESSSKERNLKMEAMTGLFDGSKILYIRANSAKEIVQAVRFGQEKGVQKIVILAGTEALDAASFLAENKIPVILPNVHSLPSSDEVVELPYELAGLLTKAGVTIALSHNGMLARARNLPFYAGTAAAYGLGKEEAVQAITLNAAKVLGIDSEVGSLEEGKRATLFVSKGDALDMMTNNLTHAYIDGKTIQLEGEQQALYKQYSDKYAND